MDMTYRDLGRGLCAVIDHVADLAPLRPQLNPLVLQFLECKDKLDRPIEGGLQATARQLEHAVTGLVASGWIGPFFVLFCWPDREIFDIPDGSLLAKMEAFARTL